MATPSPRNRSVATGCLLATLLATGCATDSGSRDRDRDRGSTGGGGATAPGGSGPAAPRESPDLQVAVDRLELRDVDLEVEGLTADVSLSLSFLGIVSAELRVEAGADRLALKVGELLGDARVDARLGVLAAVIEDIVKLFEENPDLLQRLQLRMRLGGTLGMAEVPSPGGGGGDGGPPAPASGGGSSGGG